MSATDRGSHYDVMFETAQGLLTWAVEQLPVAGRPAQSATPLPLHRAAYLDYEGPVSGNRGTVRRIQAGTYQQNLPDADASAVFNIARSRSRQTLDGSEEHPNSGEFGYENRVTALRLGVSPNYFEFACQGIRADGHAVSQLFVFDRDDERGWELRLIDVAPK